MNKKQMLYLSGLISEEKLNETSDFEDNMSKAYKMQREFNELYEKLKDCVVHCKDLQKQVQANSTNHNNRVDSRGITDADYFRDLSHDLGLFYNLLRGLFGRSFANSDQRRADEIKESFQELIDRLNADF
jgi:hypothetical protein